jgi:PAS domain S-box-containing protein
MASPSPREGDLPEGEQLAQRRLSMLTRLAGAGERAHSLQAAIGEICDVLVPEFADVCMVDAVVGGVPERLAARASGPRAVEKEQFVMRRGPEPVSAEVSFTAAVSGGEPVLLEQVTDQTFQGWARDAEDLRGLRSLETRSAIVLPLRSREQLVGVLTLLTTHDSGRDFKTAELDFASVLAGRVAITLDNAGLTRRLVQMERQLASALGSLAEAILLQDVDGSVVFANDAAFDFAGLRRSSIFDVDALLARIGLFDPDGKLLRPSDLPAARLRAGEQEVEPMLLRAVLRGGEERWLLAKSMPVPGEDGRPSGTVSIFEDVTRWRREDMARQLLTEASGIFSSSFDYEETLAKVAELTSGVLADACMISVPDELGDLRVIARTASSERRSPQIETLLAQLEPGTRSASGAAAVFKGGEALLLNGISEQTLLSRGTHPHDMRRLLDAEIGALLIVPLCFGTRTIGVMTLYRVRVSGPFSEQDLSLAEELGRRAGNAIESARLYTERMRVTSLLQRALRPPTLRRRRGWRLAALYEPAGSGSEVGGDFYDFFSVPDGQMAVIGDVAGHGALAARLTAMARHTLRTAGELTGDPLAAIGQLNRAFRSREELSLATAACIHLKELADDRVLASVVVAGHPLPLLRASDRVETLGRPGTLIGFVADGAWPVVEHELQRGQTLLLYTDGVIDTRRADDFFGEQRLRDCLDRSPGDPAQLISLLEERLQRFRDRDPQDDVAALAIEPVTAAARATASR